VPIADDGPIPVEPGAGSAGGVQIRPQFSHPYKPIKVVVVHLAEKPRLRQDVALYPARDDCLQGELDCVTGEVVSARIAPPPQKQPGVVQLADGQRLQIASADRGQG
jgi:hypothetical protein